MILDDRRLMVCVIVITEESCSTFNVKKNYVKKVGKSLIYSDKGQMRSRMLLQYLDNFKKISIIFWDAIMNLLPLHARKTIAVRSCQEFLRVRKKFFYLITLKRIKQQLANTF